MNYLFWLNSPYQKPSKGLVRARFVTFLSVESVNFLLGTLATTAGVSFANAVIVDAGK